MIMMIIACIGYWGFAGCKCQTKAGSGSSKERDFSPSRWGRALQSTMLATHASSKYCQLICGLDILKHHMLFFPRFSRTLHFNSHIVKVVWDS